MWALQPLASEGAGYPDAEMVLVHSCCCADASVAHKVANAAVREARDVFILLRLLSRRQIDIRSNRDSCESTRFTIREVK